jgi:hypothetical protein
MTEEDKKNAKILTLQSQNLKQRNEITRLTVALDKLKRETQNLLKDVNWMKGQHR